MSGKRYNPKDFKVVEENKEDFRFSVIERSNMKNEFTLADIESSQKELQRVKKEMESQRKLCVATCKNIEENHKFIKKLTDEQMHHVWMYQENKVVADDAAVKLTEVDEQIADYENMSNIIHEVGGFVKSGDAVTIDPDELKG
jgi:hypothetical protein